VTVGVDAEATRSGPGRRRDRPVSQDDTFGRAGRAARGHYEGVAGIYRPSSRLAATSTRAFDEGRAELLQYRGLGRTRQALVDREHRVASVPSGEQGRHERRAAREIDCDQFQHGR